MMLLVRSGIKETDQTLRQSVAQQANLRNILWVNLLIQRASNMALVAREQKDASYFERAKVTAESLSQPLSGILSDDESTLKLETKKEIQSEVENFQSKIEQISRNPSQLAELVAIAEKTGAELNQIESDGWFRLNAHNENLLNGIQKGHDLLLMMLTIFVGYLALLGLILHWKKKAEEALRGAEAKMLNSARISALGEMAGGVAHEINNPLATINLLTEQVKDVLLEKPEENKFAVERLAKITTTVKRIGQIVLALRTFSRDGSGDGFEPISTRELLDSSLSLCQEKFKHRGIAVSLDIQPSDHLTKCQHVQFSQVLLNLFSNACDAVEKLPEKWIKVTVINTPDGLTRYQITDSGKGISDVVQEKMFNPFYTTKEIGKGTGLGLSISQGIVKAHSGRLYLDRTCPNTSFVIELPAVSVQGLKKAA
jgi:C4-dicarboxylate-specific signal transduction histidine kinase